MRLLSVDVVADAVVKQVWRAPLAGVAQDLVLVVSDIGRVATVWVVPRDDLDGMARPGAATERNLDLDLCVLS